MTKFKNVLNKPIPIIINKARKSIRPGQIIEGPDSFGKTYGLVKFREDVNFKIITACYNCEEWIEKCILSVVSQTYKKWEMCIINDGSTDLTKQIIDEYVKSCPKIKCIHNEKNTGNALENRLAAVRKISTNKEDVIADVDGDDWLASNDVLDFINELYKDPALLLTYGQYEPLSHNYHNYCDIIEDTRNYRKNQWLSSHLKTYKKKLFDKIKDEDLRDKNGNYFKSCSDSAIMFPMIEMAGLRRIRFVARILYVYNDLNNMNVYKIHRKENLGFIEQIRNKQPYKELEPDVFI